VQPEDLDFLCGLDARARLTDVVELAPLRGAAEVERVALRVEVRLADEGRDERNGEQRDQLWRKCDEPRGEADDRDDVLRLAKELRDQAGAASGLALCMLEPV